MWHLGCVCAAPFQDFRCSQEGRCLTWDINLLEIKGQLLGSLVALPSLPGIKANLYFSWFFTPEISGLNILSILASSRIIEQEVKTAFVYQPALKWFLQWNKCKVLKWPASSQFPNVCVWLYTHLGVRLSSWIFWLRITWKGKVILL